MTKTRRVQQISGWLIVIIGLVHLTVTFIAFGRLSLSALWFAGSGFALLIIGGLNVVLSGLDDEMFGRLRTLRFLALMSDLGGVFLGLTFTGLTAGTEPQGPILTALFAVVAIAQMRR